MTDVDTRPNPSNRRSRWWAWLVAGAFLGVVLGYAIGTATSSPDPTIESRQPSGGDSSPDALPVEDSAEPPATTDEGHEHGPSPTGWRETAQGFGVTFTNTALGAGVWHDALAAWLTPAQAAEYRNVPIEHVPAGTLMATDVTDPDGSLFTTATLTYGTGMVLAIGLSYDGATERWLVASIMPGGDS